MVIERCIYLEQPSEWKDALTGIKHAFAHTWGNCHAMHLTTGYSTYLYTFEKDGVRIVCPIAERTFGEFSDIVTPYGFSGFVGNRPCPEFSNYWKGFVQEKGYICGYIGLNPIFEESSYFESKDVFIHNKLHIMDLSLSSDNLYKNLSSNRKRQLRYFEKDQENFFLDRPILIEFFLNNFHDFIRERKASAVYEFSLDTLSFLLNLENSLLVGIMDGGRVIAVTVFVYTPYVGDFLFNVSLPDGKPYSVSLLWYGVNYLKSIGVPYLNLGGGVRENDSLDLFKRRFGANLYPLMALKQVYQPEIYKELCQQVHVNANDRSGFFPPYHRV